MCVTFDNDVENVENPVKRNPAASGSSRKTFGNLVKRNFLDMQDNGENLAKAYASLFPDHKKAFEDAVLSWKVLKKCYVVL